MENSLITGRFEFNDIYIKLSYIINHKQGNIILGVTLI